MGKDPGIIGGDIALLPKIAETATASGFPETLKTYEKAKTELAAIEKKTDNLFKGWREAKYRFALGELKTDRAVKSALEDLTAALSQAIEMKKKLVTATEGIQKVLLVS